MVCRQEEFFFSDRHNQLVHLNAVYKARFVREILDFACRFALLAGRKLVKMAVVFDPWTDFEGPDEIRDDESHDRTGDGKRLNAHGVEHKHNCDKGKAHKCKQRHADFLLFGSMIIIVFAIHVFYPPESSTIYKYDTVFFRFCK